MTTGYMTRIEVRYSLIPELDGITGLYELVTEDGAYCPYTQELADIVKSCVSKHRPITTNSLVRLFSELHAKGLDFTVNNGFVTGVSAGSVREDRP